MNRALRFDAAPASLFAAATALTLVLTANPARAAAPWDITPRAPWAAPVPLPDDSHADSASRGGVRVVVSDTQVRVTDGAVERYVHDARHVVGSAGVERVAEVRVSFDPQYERLHLHAVRVLRGGKSRDVLSKEIVRTFYEESDEDARVYDGRMAALVVLPDVRVGDTVETEMTVTGSNPVFGGKYIDTYGLGSPFDARLFRFRLLTPTARTFATQLQGAGLTPTTREAGAVREQTWTREDAPGFESEGDLPHGYDPIPRLRISEYRSWEEVAQWARALFPNASIGKKGALASALDTIRAASPNQADRALAAMHLVQDDVRYLGLELGENSHRPHDPETVLAQRFGDCKDKAYLLVTLLRGLGIEAHVALVNARRGDAVPGMPPSPGAFNHAIVHASLEGVQVFIDATVSGQGGSFYVHPIGDFGHALCVEAGANGLTPVRQPSPEGPTVATLESYHRTLDGSVALDVETTYRDGEGEEMRRYLTEVPPAEIAKRYLNGYAKMYSGIEPSGPLDVADDRGANRVVVGEHYLIPKSHAFDWSYDASSLREALSVPRTILRQLPLEVSPVYRRHQIAMTVDGRAQGLPKNLIRKTAAFDFQRTTDVNGDTVRITYDLRALTSEIAPSDVESHLRAMKDLRSELDGELDVVAREPRSTGSSGSWVAGVATVLGAVFVVGAIVAVRRTSTLRRRFRWNRKLARKKGETAATALGVATVEEAARHIHGTACACGRKPVLLTGCTWTELRYQGRLVTSASLHCDCGTRRVFYFAMTH